MNRLIDCFAIGCDSAIYRSMSSWRNISFVVAITAAAFAALLLTGILAVIAWALAVIFGILGIVALVASRR